MSPQSLAPIPLETEITDTDGTITSFFRLRWQQLVDSFTRTPTAAALEKLTQNAAIVTTTVFTTKQSGSYRITVTVQKTVADGVASTLTVTVGWVSRGIAETHTFAALATDAIGANDSVSWTFAADANADITYAVGYTSTTPGQMKFNANVSLEFLA